MDKDESKNTSDNKEPPTMPTLSPYEEELKDYNKSGKEDEDPIDNLPDSHPEPSPTKN